ncbi:MAG TPA: cobalamin-dependent protein, partial [Pyrinomonadaceae bacterium]|nr:cobalamin-dependent protein [Pyrinomonadaceae bacterium]
MFVSKRRIRVLVAKLSLDGHDRGAKVIVGFLRDAGMDVIYTDLRQTAEMIAEAAAREDVDVVGLSFLNGAHNTLCKRVVALLRAKSMDDCLVVVCDLVAQEDAQILNEQGISKVFPPGASPHAVVEYMQTNVRP